jgi:hypothetical protein
MHSRVEWPGTAPTSMIVAGGCKYLARDRRSKFEAPPLEVRVRTARYVAARTRDLAPVAIPDLGDEGAPSYTAAGQALWRHEEERPEDRGALQIVTVFATED